MQQYKNDMIDYNLVEQYEFFSSSQKITDELKNDEDFLYNVNDFPNKNNVKSRAVFVK